eukprot:CAMPEP_0116855894 /NCGR_PEP_ID=MMETSP0418-20121206/19569_1 /TAXON_ID=1158023 /ORGANISM="Astrosyne radiata, Strain 13vi08-1A" /LENGTH=94 /DNA_ID=CAMNT_0004489153 /DNA_START=44 /DNA_END=328 /DNA_ORIENTATION=-
MTDKANMAGSFAGGCGQSSSTVRGVYANGSPLGTLPPVNFREEGGSRPNDLLAFHRVRRPPTPRSAASRSREIAILTTALALISDDDISALEKP